jgi:ELWxxDGT repeat protein
MLLNRRPHPSQLPNRSHHLPSARPRFARPRLEALEDRQLPSAVEVLDIRPGAFSSNPTSLTAVGNDLYFVADDGVHGSQLWKTDGTATHTVPVPTDRDGAAILNPQNLANINGTLYFAGSTSSGHTLVWKSDGTPAGTVALHDFGAAAFPREFTSFAGKVYFTAQPPSQAPSLWISDGTSAGTVMLSAVSPAYPADFTVVSSVPGALYFIGGGLGHSTSLWKVDATGVNAVRDFPAISNLLNFQSQLYFVASPGSSFDNLWVTDGTSAGTHVVTPFTTRSVVLNLTIAGNNLYFTALVTGPPDDFGLWKSVQGTAFGTSEVKSLTQTLQITSTGNRLFFADTDPLHGIELWTSDGTTQGTTLVKDILPGTGGGTPGPMVNFNGTLFFAAIDGVHGQELWQSDGTSNGTQLVQDINPGSANASPVSFTPVGANELFFTASNGTDGRELWLFTPSAPAVQSVAIDNGATQRSLVRSATVAFDRVVNFSGSPTAAFQLARAGPGTPTGIVTLAVDLSGSTATQTVARLTFSGLLTEGAGSLIDGDYTLSVFSAQLQGGLQGGDNVTSLFRLFGDVNGDRTVNVLDLAAFRNAFGTLAADANYLSFLDFNGDGTINSTDLTQFRNRFGVILP